MPLKRVVVQSMQCGVGRIRTSYKNACRGRQRLSIQQRQQLYLLRLRLVGTEQCSFVCPHVMRYGLWVMGYGLWRVTGPLLHAQQEGVVCGEPLGDAGEVLCAHDHRILARFVR